MYVWYSTQMLPKDLVTKAYIHEKRSVSEIARRLGCSEHKVNYWLAKYKIKKRSISDAIYQMHNPLGDPFVLTLPRNVEEGILYGVGLGLYWGEGSKRGRGGVRLGNTDVRLVKKFIVFLEKAFKIKRSKLKFGLQIFRDISPDKARAYWIREPKVKKTQFYKVVVSQVRGEGTYKYKSEYGVLMVYFNNTRLKQLLCNIIDNMP